MATESRNDKAVDLASPIGTPQSRHNGATWAVAVEWR